MGGRLSLHGRARHLRGVEALQHPRRHRREQELRHLRRQSLPISVLICINRRRRRILTGGAANRSSATRQQRYQAASACIASLGPHTDRRRRRQPELRRLLPPPADAAPRGARRRAGPRKDAYTRRTNHLIACIIRFAVIWFRLSGSLGHGARSKSSWPAASAPPASPPPAGQGRLAGAVDEPPQRVDEHRLD